MTSELPLKANQNLHGQRSKARPGVFAFYILEVGGTASFKGRFCVAISLRIKGDCIPGIFQSPANDMVISGYP